MELLLILQTALGEPNSSALDVNIKSNKNFEITIGMFNLEAAVKVFNVDLEIN